MKRYILLLAVFAARGFYVPTVEAQCQAPVVVANAATVCPGGQTVLSAQPGDYWTRKNDLPHDRSHAVAFSIGGTGYLTTGFTDSHVYDNSTWAYDTLRDVWTQKADFAGAGREAAAGFVLEGKGFVAGGVNTAINGDLWQYDPGANVWTQKAFLPNGRRIGNAMTFTIGNDAWLAGGTDGSAISSAVWSYDAGTDQWTARAPLPAPTQLAGAFSIGGKGYLVGGDQGGAPVSSVYAYDPGTDTWSTLNNFPGVARHEAASFTMGNSGFMVGGVSATSKVNEVWQFNAAADSWTLRAAIPGGSTEARQSPASFVIGGRAWVFGGLAGVGINPVKDVWEYAPAISYQWSNGATTATITAGAGVFTVTTTDVNGCAMTSRPDTIRARTAVAVVPGAAPALCPGQQLTLYGDTGNVWTQQQNIPAAIRIYPVSFSIGSKGYIGTGSWSAVLSDWWEYDEATGVWTQKADVPGGGRQLATAFAINDKGYVGLGGGATGLLQDFWEYDPFTNTWTARANFPGGPCASAVGFAIGSQGYVGLGQTGAGYPTNFWSFDPIADQWTAISPFPGSGRRESMAFSIGNKGYVTCGWANAVNNVNDCWQYDPVTGIWTAQAPLPGAPRRTGATFTIQDHAYVVAGYSTVNLDECWEFYNGAWTRKATYPGGAQWGLGAISFHDHALVLLGTSSNQQVWNYHPNNTLQWPDGSTGQTYTINAPGSYSATVHDIEGCSIPTTPLKVGTQNLTASIASAGAITFCAGKSDTLAANGDAWTKKGDFPGGADWYSTGFALGSMGYLCGGWGNLAQFWQYDPATDTWSQQANLPVQVLQVPAIAWNGKAYLLAGKAAWVYDPVYNSWTQKAAFPGTVQAYAQGFLLNNQLIVAGGGGAGNIPIAEVWAYDLAADTWTRKNDMPVGVIVGTAFAINGKGYVCTGNSTRLAGAQDSVFLQYDPAADTWTSLPGFPGGPRGGAIGFTDGHRAYVGLGNHGPALTDLWQYDPASQQWTRMQDIPAGRYTPAVFLLGHYAYIATGAGSSSTLSDVWQYELPYLYAWSDGETTRRITVKQSGSYSVNVTNYDGCAAASASVPITVQDTTHIAAPPADATVCEPAGARFTVSATGTGLTYQWLLNGQPLADGGAYDGSQTAQLSVLKTTGPDSLKLRNVIAGVCGTDTTPVVTLTVHPVPGTPVISAGGPTAFCQGGNVQLTSTPAAFYRWSNGATTQGINVDVSGIYTLKITDGFGCISAVSSPDTVQVNPYPAGPIVTEGPLLAGSSHVERLTAPSAPGYQYVWSTGATTPVIEVGQSGDYSVEVSTAAGCRTTLLITVQLIDLTKVPNTFSPNHDGINDVWYVKAIDPYPNAEVMIFNRDGTRVFEAKNPGIKWDGTSAGRELPAGVYYYIIDLKDGSKPVTGWINLVR